MITSPREKRNITNLWDETLQDVVNNQAINFDKLMAATAPERREEAELDFWQQHADDQVFFYDPANQVL